MTTLSQFVAASGRNLVEARPLWKDGGHKSEKVFLKWFEDMLPMMEEFNKPRIYEHWNNLLWYTGDIVNLVSNKVLNPDFTGYVNRDRRVLPFVISHLTSLAERRANDLSQLRPEIETVPTNLEEADRITARVMKVIVDHIKRFNNVEMNFNDTELTNVVCGEAWDAIEWNENIGDRKGRNSTKFEGEVQIREKTPWHLLLWPHRHFSECRMIWDVHEILHVDEARKKYKMPSLQPEKRSALYTFSSPWEEEIWPEEVVIWRVWYKPDEYLPEGAVITTTREKVIDMKWEKYPYSHMDFPFERHTDMTIRGRVFPMSVFRFIKPLQYTYNMMSGLMKKAVFNFAHPKWFMVRGACNIQSLGNAMTIVQHKMGMEPKLQVFPQISGDTFAFRNGIKQEMEQLIGSSPLSRGEVPPNTRSGVQISRLQNIERQGQASKAYKRNDFMLRVLQKAASVAGDYYPQTSERHLLRVVGKENSVDVVSLKGVKISSKYAMFIQNSTGFASDTAGRLEELAFARQQLPGLLLPQQEADILGLRSPQKFYDITTAALRTAESENDSMNDGRAVPAPLKEEDHIQHWITHVIDFNTMAYKRMDPKVRQMKLDHLKVHEMWMEELAAMNPAFKQKLAMLDRYPLVFHLNKDRVAIENEMGPPPGPPMQVPGIPMPGEAPQGSPPAPKGTPPAPKLQ